MCLGFPAIVILLEIKTDLWSVVCCHIRRNSGEAKVDYSPLEILTFISDGAWYSAAECTPSVILMGGNKSYILCPEKKLQKQILKKVYKILE